MSVPVYPAAQEATPLNLHTHGLHVSPEGNAGKGNRLSAPSWPQFVSTLTPSVGSELPDGTYRPILAPVNFSETTEGAQYFTNPLFCQCCCATPDPARKFSQKRLGTLKVGVLKMWCTVIGRPPGWRATSNLGGGLLCFVLIRSVMWMR